MKFNITRGIIVKPQKVVIYGPEGIGKTSFAADFPDALFIDTEGSTNLYNVARLPSPSSWSMLLEEVGEVIKTPGICKTLVIDTIDWAEHLCVEYICAKHNKKGIEDFGYGNGYIYAKEEFGRFLNLLSDVIEKGVHVVLTAHSHIRKFEQPNESGSYDRYELKLGKKTSSQTAPLVKEWADMILFANYKVLTYNQNKDGKGKAVGGERVMYTTHHPNWDAKNRHDLPEELPFAYKNIASCITSINADIEAEPPARQETETTAVPTSVNMEKPCEPQQEIKSVDIPVLQADAPPEAVTVQQERRPSTIPKALSDLMTANNVKLEEVQKVVADKGYYPPDTPFENYAEDFVQGCLIGAWEAVFTAIQGNRYADVPF